jgi:geranyl-CoA carboxylase alpha subunit
MFNSVLVANRGEIACRIIRTARQIGLRTIAVYSQADSAALHVGMADQALLIGPAPARESYLSIERIIEAAKRSGAEAVHPGYGFLSENAEFARALEAAGIALVGPPAAAIEAMGNKAGAKKLMLKAGVPCIPGHEGAQDLASMQAAAERIGYPVMVKAAAGGGGRGMRRVEQPQALEAALSSAAAEALNAFGSSELILEKAIDGARHVEIQVFGDKHGNIIHLGERDCSLQRRHQKIIEEAPSPAVTPALRTVMGEAAVRAAQSVGYVGAGTVEFLLDQAGNPYFLEMNTRLQVEHPVTEMVTGLDLVALQFAVAFGEPLPIRQQDVAFSGHAIEARLYCEDPANGFLPSTGKVLRFYAAEDAGVRIDSGIAGGSEVTAHYDPMVAKIIAHGATREEARLRLIDAVASTEFFGPKSNAAFLAALLQSPQFAAGQATTDFIDRQFAEGFKPAPPDLQTAALAALATCLEARHRALADAPPIADELLGWSSTGRLSSRIDLESDGMRWAFSALESNGVITLEVNGQSLRFTDARLTGAGMDARLDGARLSIPCEATPDGTHVHADGVSRHFRSGRKAIASAGAGGADGTVAAPMHGRIIEVFAAEGTTIKAGDGLLTMEAMKMQHRVSAPIDGRVARLAVAAGQQVAAGDLLAQIETAAVTLPEADDFLAETLALCALFKDRPESDFARPTRFKGWTANDILVHLHFWNKAADLSLNDPAAFMALFAELAGFLSSGSLRSFENAQVSERGLALLTTYEAQATAMAGRWRRLDPKHRVKWAGPDMSVRSAMTARQMETWAHGQAVFDLFGVDRRDEDRIRNIVVLGVNTYQWSFKVHGLAAPGPMPKLKLSAPSGAVWEFGDGEGVIEGAASEFAQVITQTRNIADTALRVVGETARLWMGNAQCFAGPPETPPAPGTRRRD